MWTLHTNCLTFDISGHIDGTSTPTGADAAAWHRLVKLWLYGTLAPKLFRSLARNIWVWVENQFWNNKEARAIQLDIEFRTTEIGDMTIHVYCQKLKSPSDLLTNVDAPVSDRTLVIYMLNGLNEHFDNIINATKHREPSPSFGSDPRSADLPQQDLIE